MWVSISTEMTEKQNVFSLHLRQMTLSEQAKFIIQMDLGKLHCEGVDSSWLHILLLQR